MIILETNLLLLERLEARIAPYRGDKSSHKHARGGTRL